MWMTPYPSQQLSNHSTLNSYTSPHMTTSQPSTPLPPSTQTLNPAWSPQPKEEEIPSSHTWLFVCLLGMLMNKFMKRVKEKDTPLWCRLDQQELKPQFYAFRWLTLLLSQEFSLPGNSLSQVTLPLPLASVYVADLGSRESGGSITNFTEFKVKS